MPDKLFFGDLLIGEILRSGTEFPWFHGEFHSRLDTNDIRSLAITKYIDYSIRQSNFFSEQTESNPLTERQDELLKEEQAFGDLIYSDQWGIIDHKGEITMILIPVFHADGTIGWRMT